MTDGMTSKSTCVSDTVAGGNQSQDARSLRVAAYFVLPFFVSVLNYLFSPGYLIPFLDAPVGRSIFLVVIFWHGIGTWLFTRTSKFKLQVLIGILFMAPLVLAPILGPAFTTSAPAMAPIWNSK